MPEQDGLRLTTGIVGCAPDDVEIGMPVQVTFEQYEDVWLPFFEPVAMTRASVDAVISGIGQSDVGRRLHRDPLDLTLDACLDAIEDAGLTRDDIDGIATYPGAMDTPPGFSGVGVTEVHDALRLNLNWYAGGLEAPGQLGSVVNACMAVATGLADHVLCFRTVWEGSAQGDKGRSAGHAWHRRRRRRGGLPRVGGFMQWTLPYGAPSAANWIAMMAIAPLPRVRHDARAARVDRAQRASQRRAQPEGRLPRPDDARRLPRRAHDLVAAVPLRLRRARGRVDRGDRQSRRRERRLPQAAGRTSKRSARRSTAVPSWDQWDDLTTMALRDAGAQLWTRTDLTPADVDVAELYDGFSFITLCWLEALGFCGKGEGGPFIDGGANIARDGVVPLNTHGGQLSSGRLHGYGFLHEACVQLRGEGGDRQVVRPGGRQPEVAVAGARAADRSPAACLLDHGVGSRRWQRSSFSTPSSSR